jgi:multiple sugar transport system substrate-binding protein
MQRSINRWLVGGAVAMASALALSGCGSGFDEGGDAGAGESDTSQGLTVLIGSSGDAETKAVKDAVAAWSEESGTEAKVTAANNLSQQLSQGFAAGEPADVFYLAADAFAGFASNGSLFPYGDDLANKDDFYPVLVDTFTYEDQFYCAPKDFSTLGLIINSDMWAEAGLTEDDIPTTWEELETVAKTLTTPDRAGLGIGGEYARVGAFMTQAGGNLMNASSTEATANSEENVTALGEVKKLLNDGSLKYAKDLGAGWGGEAFGKGLAAMTIEGNWITGAMQNDYPDINYQVAELPAGPAGKGTLQFTNCWGIAADSPNQEGALQLVEYLTSTESQLAFSEAFGPMPSIRSAADAWSEANPELVPFLAGAEYAQGPPTAQGAVDVVTDFNAQLETLATSDPKTILDSVQQNLESLTQ